MAQKEGARSRRIDVVFDTYRDLSIKYTERTKRNEEAGLQVKDITANQMIKQWRRFLSADTNKTELIKFIRDE